MEAYGIYELHVLEDLLRGTGEGRDANLEVVAAKIRARIGWEDTAEPAEEFLGRYYAALRARLEGRLLLGKRRANKHDRSA